MMINPTRHIQNINIYMYIKNYFLLCLELVAHNGYSNNGIYSRLFCDGNTQNIIPKMPLKYKKLSLKTLSLVTLSLITDHFVLFSDHIVLIYNIFLIYKFTLEFLVHILPLAYQPPYRPTAAIYFSAIHFLLPVYPD
jgi:hypothetical protein